MEPKWLTWSKQLQAIAQQGIEYSKDPYDVERFQVIREISVEIMTTYTENDEQTVRDLFCNEEGYQTPKVDIRGVIIENNQILLVKETIDGKWSLPGGWAEFNLSIKENVVKEVAEEAGLNVVPQRILAVQDRKYHNKPLSAYGIYKIFVLCKLVDGEFLKNIETDESGYFSLDRLPPLSETRNTKDQLELCFRGASDSQFMTAFD